MTSSENALVAVLRELAVLGTDRDREQVAAIRDRLASARLRVLVVGEAHEALKATDAAVFVLTADPPVSASERNLLRQVADLSVSTFAVLNKADHLDEAGLAEASEFTQRVLGEAAARPGGAGPRAGAGHPSRVYPMSARAALEGGDPGFAGFAADFSAYLESRRTADLKLSAIAQARRIAGSLLDEVALTRRAAQMRAGDAARRVGQFGGRLAEAAVQSRDAVRMVNAESARLLFAVNDSADEEVPRLSRDIGSRLDAMLNGDLRAASPAEIGLWGGMRLVTLTLEAVSAWRAQRQDDLEQGLARLDARLAGGLKAEFDVLRGSAAELLGLDLAVPEPGGRLTGDRRFFPGAAKDTGQADLLAGAVRRRLPGEIGRRRVREHLRSEVRGVVASQVDMARAHLQGRMAEATRTLAEVAERRYAEGTERMQAALRAAAGLRESSSAEAGRKEQELAEREVALRAVLGLLDQAAGPDTRPRAAAGPVRGMRL